MLFNFLFLWPGLFHWFGLDNLAGPLPYIDHLKKIDLFHDLFTPPEMADEGEDAKDHHMKNNRNNDRPFKRMALY